jgi:uncharacterized protein DUF955
MDDAWRHPAGDDPPPAPVEPARRGFCTALARRTLKRFKITGPPVPIERLAVALGFELRERVLPPGVDGRLRIIGGRKVIELRPRCPTHRRRFTIAHEIGHHLLGHGHERTPLAEAEANLFANAILAPGSWLARDLPATVAQLVGRYNLSPEVIFIALERARLLARVRRS